MASKEKITKKKAKLASPAVRRKSVGPKDTEKTKISVEIPEDDPQGSQVSVRSATEENIKDNTGEVKHAEPSTAVPSPIQSTSSPQHSASDMKKMKKDHVDEKLTRTTSPKEAKPNVQGEGMASMGSAVSLRSNVSRVSKEAWVENTEENEKDSRTSTTNTRSKSRRESNVVSLQQPSPVPRENGLQGIKVDVEEDSPEKHAYIPYLYARNCIAKIMEDMAAMKQNHVVIVEKIQHHYGTIESETQEQFNMFVLCLKEDYAKKRKSFRHVIDVHREELEKKEKYWNEMLASLAERNNRLLKEKKMLLMTNKTEIERLEKEREDYTKQMNEKMDKMVVAPVPVPVPWEEEKKVLLDQLETEKATVVNLQQQLGGSGPVMVMNPTNPKTEVAVNESVAMAAAGSGAVIGGGTAVAVAAHNKKLQKEAESEREKMNEERNQFIEEREKFGEERKKWMEEINRLQSDIAKKDVTGNEWKVKHDVIKLRLEEAAMQQAQYQALENQYAALALVVKKADTSSAVKEELQKTEEEKKMMQEEKTKLDKDIQQWEKDFVKKTGRKPTEDDKSDSVKEMYATQQEVKFMVTSLEQKEVTFKQLEQGTVPDPPEVSHVPIDTKDPEVVTTEVKVPDPVIVKELEVIQIELTTTKTEVINLQQDISKLQNELMQKEAEIAKQKDIISDLEKRLLEGGGVAPIPLPIEGGGGASEEELEVLKQENRELRRDMKKMIKQYERLSQRQASEGEDPAERITEMNETITQLDSKVADLETENESLREERTILRERVKTITETITITHTKENTEALEEKNKQIEKLTEELEKLKAGNLEMQKDMKKMFKSHAKSKMRVDELKDAEKAVRLLEVVAMLIHDIHGEVPDAGQKVRERLDDVENEVTHLSQSLESKQSAYQGWVEKFQSEHGHPPEKGHSDKEAEKLHADWEIAKREYKEKHLHFSALQLIKTGDASKAMEKDKSADTKNEIEINNLEKALQAADGKVIDLESENETLLKEKNQYKEKAAELEKMVEDLKKQVEADAALLAGVESSADLTEKLGELQKKCDGFESELMQEKVSHVNTRDELETLRKQMEILKEETETERKGLDARVQAATASLESQLTMKDEELTSVKTRNEELEAERLSKLPPETAKEIKELQDKLKKEKEDTSSSKTSTAALTAQIADLTAQLEVSSKNLETQRSSNRELESKLKTMRQDKEKESKRVSRHMEEKQQKATSEDKQRIAVLVKRVKELEAQVGKGVGVGVVPVPVGGGGKGNDAQVHMLRRELKDKEAQIKQLEKEVRLGGATGGGGKEAAADRMGKTKQEKILKELDRKLESEASKSEKLLAGLKAADEENQALKKELDEKSKNLNKVSAELKTLSLAAKEGVEAAGKVKELEKDNKKLTEENVVLTKNFESERVLRKKYYNMVEDMKGKIRVYCRSRPLSKTELGRGNKSVCRSADEYSISVDTSRGLKEFQYDQVFMEDSTQERIFEDTNNLIQSAVDGYNVCIFAYGQTGSGKTFTMIGDKDQKFPGIAPRAFERIFQLVDELKSKFTISIECYMLELYNDKLIDLFSKPGAADDKLEIKKDKKGMVYVQGSVIKPAHNSKELFALFEEGSANRHTAATKMNAESSRSHLIIGIIMEAANKNTGNVTRGKLSLVDLAGSERVAKTGAGAEQLKEAMSINKSLSALGDVISALSSEQQFIPYRNNKLTMLMQDSLGGNAKTLMFVNISPADYNMDETVISLTYASRVKLITNDASKNADNKEIARLKNVIARLKKGEQVEEEDV